MPRTQATKAPNEACHLKAMRHINASPRMVYHMSKNDNRSPAERRYPPIYEKAIPIALVIITVAILALFVIIVAVTLGLIQ